MSITKELQALRDYKDGDDLMMLAVDALVALEPNLASKSELMVILVLVVRAARTQRGEFLAKAL
jgi:hypothetical protein